VYTPSLLAALAWGILPFLTLLALSVPSLMAAQTLVRYAFLLFRLPAFGAEGGSDGWLVARQVQPTLTGAGLDWRYRVPVWKGKRCHPWFRHFQHLPRTGGAHHSLQLSSV
jgi:hypothetical protein